MGRPGSLAAPLVPGGYTGSWSAGPTGGGGVLSRRLKPASLRLTLRPLSQAPLLGRRCRPHGYLSGAAISPPVRIHRQLRPKDSLLPVKEAEVLTLQEPFPHSSTRLRDAPVEARCPIATAQEWRGVGAGEQAGRAGWGHWSPGQDQGRGWFGCWDVDAKNAQAHP